MKCAACHHDMLRKMGEIDLRINGKLYLVENVSYEECPVCGEKVITPEVSEMLFRKINNEDFVQQTIRVPVLDGTYG